MSIKFHLPDGVDSDIVVNSLKFFTVATPEDFRDLQFGQCNKPARCAPLGGTRSLPQKPSQRGKSQCHARHAGQFRRRAVFRHRRVHLHRQVRPETAIPLHHRARASRALSKEEIAKKPANYLIDDLPQRLAKGAVKFHIKAQLAAPGDQTKDPTQAWPDDRKVSIWAR